MHARLSLALAVSLSLSFAGCGAGLPLPGACSAETCFGCCDGAGVCQIGRADLACGVAGNQCTACNPGLSCGPSGTCVARQGSGGGSGGGAGSQPHLDGGSNPGRADAGVVSTTPGSRCAGTTTACGATCRDLTTDENNCGACGHECSAGLVCNRGSCQALPTDCTNAPCPGDFGCNPETRHCTSGCFSNSDCRGDAVCTAGACRCSSAYKLQCGAVCAYADNTDCSCDPGFEARGGDCVDVDECARGTASCAAGSVCKNTAGAYECQCPPGTLGTPGHCEVDECATNNGGCGAHGQCSDYPGSPRYCDCDYGYLFDGTTCAPTCSVGYQACVNPALSCYPGPNGDRCLAPGAKAAGELCTAAPDCQRGLSCSVNATTHFGVCEATCSSSCGTGYSCVSSLCRPNNAAACHPVAQDCNGSSLGCYLGSSGATCQYAGRLAEGATCQYVNDCGPGLVCLSETGPTGHTCKPFCPLGVSGACSNGRTCSAIDGTVFAACL